MSEQIQQDSALDQPPDQKAVTALLGLVQVQAEQQGWDVDVVSSDEKQAVLGLTSPDGTNYSLSMNVTP